MFDTSVPDLDELVGAHESMVIAAITGWARIEAAASARRLAAIAELVARRTDGDADYARWWACDDWDATAAEVGSALHVSHGKASAQMYLAAALRDRLPQVAQAFAEGLLSTQIVALIAWHTTLIQDPDALALVDKALAADAGGYGPLSAAKTVAAIEAIVDRYDPGALRRTRDSARGRELVIDKTRTENGITPLWGKLYATDAELLDRRLMQLAHSVCDEDPRTVAQRRADALGALVAGADRLTCRCTDPDCAAATAPDRPGGQVLIHVLADHTALAAPADPQQHGDPHQPPPETPEAPETPETAPETPETAPETPAPATDPPPAKRTPALLAGGPQLPAPLLADLITDGATVKLLHVPAADTAPEPGYRPSATLADFIRARDLTCRFPNCDAPAEYCDIDHGVPHGTGGPTHPSNLRCLCRKHHLLKTFHHWRDQQHPDGTIDWTSPAGQTYITRPGSRLLFPALCQPTGRPPTPAPAANQPRGERTLMMPARKHTRAHDRAKRINSERALNATHVAERNKPPPF
ncbi:MAG TPA: DUF222 domain-containing protein [Mycobacterium sp.]|nr:DUF222 domain-containing protein [Mycobacterium sp.]